jgi:hypothetical protein
VKYEKGGRVFLGMLAFHRILASTRKFSAERLGKSRCWDAAIFRLSKRFIGQLLFCFSR